MAKRKESTTKAVRKVVQTIANAVLKPGQPRVFPKDYTDTSQLPVAPLLVDQIIGQDKAVNLIKKASAQKRNVLLVGTPGTGKSMLAQAMSELLPVQELEDIIVAFNPEDDNVPKIRVVKAGDAKKIQQAERMKSKAMGGNINLMLSLFLMASVAIIIFVLPGTGMPINLIAAMLVGMFILGAAMLFASQVGRQRMAEPGDSIKVLIDNSNKKKAPFVDATGSKAGALLGDVRHDPFQSGGLGTPAHLRVEAGFIHKAHKGILFIDEASTLRPKAQQELLTAMQEKKYGITGQSELSSGALVKTEPVPCDFILVAAGNYQDVAKMHPALRSRIRGYGYEVFMEESIEDNETNRNKFAVFVAQEVTKDGKIPHFTREAVEEILLEARRRAGRKNKLTLRMRELGGLVRAAGDVAREAGAKLVEKQHVLDAKRLAATLEQQATQSEIEVRKEYRVFQNEGKSVGRVNGLAVMGDAGIALPIVAEMAPAGSKNEGKIIATGKLGKIAEEAVKNVSAILKKHLGKDTSNFDIHIQFLQTYEGVEGDSASISVATAVISALEDAPLRQDIAMTGSLSVRGDVLPVGGVTYKAEAALDAGIHTIIVPKANAGDIILSKEKAAKLKIIPVSSLYEVLSIALAESPKKAEILSKVKKELQ
ncbi:MAG: ATP-dependent protease LonB [Candidatus Micrarchaeia archaeon]